MVASCGVMFILSFVEIFYLVKKLIDADKTHAHTQEHGESTPPPFFL
jgi:hypothetical protein